MNFQNWMARLGNEIELLEVNYFQTTGSEKMNIHTHPAQLYIACFERGKGLFSLNGILRKIRPGDFSIKTLFAFPEMDKSIRA